MAENWATLKSVRLKLRDPSGFISFQTVATALGLPATPAPQTAYRVEDISEYQSQVMGVWARSNLRISDETLNDLIDIYGESGAIIRSLSQIIASLYEELRMVNMSSGSESMQFQTLTDTLAFYNSLRTMYKEEKAEVASVSTGRIINTERLIIGGVQEY